MCMEWKFDYEKLVFVYNMTKLYGYDRMTMV